MVLPNLAESSEQDGQLAVAVGPVVHAIYRIARMSRTIMAGLLRSSGLYPGQELLLMQLFERDWRSQSELVKALDLDPSTVTKMVQRMEKAGWVEREPADHDRRVVLVSLSAKGRHLRGEIENAWKGLEQLTTECLTSGQLDQLCSTLSRIEEHIADRAGSVGTGLAHLASL